LFSFVAVVLGNPETPTVSHSFPKVCAALQKNCGIEIGTGINRGLKALLCLRLVDDGHYRSNVTRRPRVAIAEQPCAIPLI